MNKGSCDRLEEVTAMAMHEMGEWGAVPAPLGAGLLSPEREAYVSHLRDVHDDGTFILAVTDRLEAPSTVVRRLVFEAEMLANYGVIY